MCLRATTGTQVASAGSGNLRPPPQGLPSAISLSESESRFLPEPPGEGPTQRWLGLGLVRPWQGTQVMGGHSEAETRKGPWVCGTFHTATENSHE